MLEVQNVTKRYDQKIAVDNFSLHIENGEIVGLIGANGAGKSTCLRMLSGVILPDEGSITYDDRLLKNDMQLRQQLFFFPDELFFFSGATIKDAANFYKIFYPSFDTEVFEKLCETFELPLKTKIIKLSKGMKRQVMMIIGISIRPAYFILDEAFDGIDSVVKVTFKNILEKLVSQYNTTVIIASHNIREIEDICRRIVLMYQSKLILDSDIEQLKAEAEQNGTDNSLEAILIQKLEGAGYGSKNISFI